MMKIEIQTCVMHPWGSKAGACSTLSHRKKPIDSSVEMTLILPSELSRFGPWGDKLLCADRISRSRSSLMGLA
jgi:hypothetical protein